MMVEGNSENNFLFDKERETENIRVAEHAFSRAATAPDESAPASNSTSLSLNDVLDTAPLLIPSDGLFGYQWHLQNQGQYGGTPGVDIDVTRVWDEYRGSGIDVAIIDDGFDLNHSDLAANFDTTRDYDFADNDSTPLYGPNDAHGTAVAGTIGADDNGTGMVGVAMDSTLIGLRVSFSNGTISMFDNALSEMENFDVVNNSWGYTQSFADNFSQAYMQGHVNAIQSAVANGRDGLGTNVVFAAGNANNAGDNVNYHNVQNSPYTIAVGAFDPTGNIASFSSKGAAVLTSAPGVTIFTTDNTGTAGYLSGDSVGISGTSFAAPIVSGVIALMLDANENLGYRDVQEILAYSSTKTNVAHADWQTNGADNWNGGGLHFSHSYGFGAVDAHTAVRLAETWETASTFDNIQTLTGVNNVDYTIPDGNSNTGSSITINQDIIVDQVQVTVDIAHAYAGQLELILVSPHGTQSTLVDNPGITAANTNGLQIEFPTFTFNTVANWGESAQGTWTLLAKDTITGVNGTLKGWSLNIIGDTVTPDDTYVFTDEFASSGTGTYTLNDTNGGIDTVNASAISGSVSLDLTNPSGGFIGSRGFAIDSNAQIEKIYTGDGNDVITGNNDNNTITTGRGNDTVFASAGNDDIDGGAGNDLYMAFTALNHNLTINGTDDITLTDRVSGDTTRLVNFETYSFGGTTYDLQSLMAAAQITPADPINFILRTVNDSVIATSDILGNQDITMTDLGLGNGDGITMNRTENTLSITNLAGAALRTADVNQSVAATLSIDEFFETRIDMNFKTEMDIQVTNSQFGLVKTGSKNDTINFDTKLIDADTSNAEKTVKIYGRGGDDDITLNDTNGYALYDIRGGNGNDTITINGGTSGKVNGGKGDDIINDGDGVGNLLGQAGNDIIYGNGGNDRLRGNDGEDQLFGGDGDDQIWGGLDYDIINGGAGNDILRGEDGNDTIIGGGGYDRYYGGAGNDTFVIDIFDTQIDRIYDFESTGPEADKIDLSLLLTGYNEGDDIDPFIDFIVRSTHTNIVVDQDGTGPGGKVTIATIYGQQLDDSVQSYIDDGLLIVTPIVD